MNIKAIHDTFMVKFGGLRCISISQSIRNKILENGEKINKAVSVNNGYQSRTYPRRYKGIKTPWSVTGSPFHTRASSPTDRFI